jgi:hypothetical protein
MLDGHVCSDCEYSDGGKGDSQPRANAQIADGLSHLRSFRIQKGSSRESDPLDVSADYVQLAFEIQPRMFSLFVLVLRASRCERADKY